MYIQWTSHISDVKDKVKFEKAVFGSKATLNRLTEILKEKENDLDRFETSIETYDSPNWAARQAFKNGQRSLLGFVRKLIDLDQQTLQTENPDQGAQN